MARFLSRSPRPLNIIHEVPPHVPLPVATYGGTERVVQGLLRGLSDAGVNVKVRCSGDSFPDPSDRAKYQLTPICEEAFGMGASFWGPKKVIEASLHNLFANAVAANGNGFPTIIHAHTEDTHLMVAHRFQTRAVVTTLHNLPKPWVRDFYNDFPMVAISNAQAASPELKGFDFVRTVYNGIDDTLYTPNFKIENDAPLVFLGRIGSKKGADTAIKIAIESKTPLVLAGPKDPEEPEFFEQEVEPALKNYPHLISYVGEVSDQKLEGEEMSSKARLLREAKALLFPIRWKEPFGMVMAEAMACGTPVVAFDYAGSSVNEIVRNGINGFKVSDETEAAEVIRTKLDTIDRQKVHADFMDRFTVKRMAEGYIKIYREVRERYLAEVRNPALIRATMP